MFDRVKHAAQNWLGIKRASGDQWVSATVRPAEANQGRHAKTDAEQLMARAVVGYAGICADKNAQMCAGVTIRLYKRADVDRGARKTKGVTHKAAGKGVHRPHLWDASRVGVKAATFADDAGEIEEVTDHPVLDLLSRPNEYMPNGTDLDYFRFKSQEITGNAYVVVATDGQGTPVGLYPMWPQYVMPIPDADEFIAGYAYGRGKEIEQVFDVSEVMHFRFRTSMHTPYLGESWIVDVLRMLDLQMAAIEQEDSRFRNGAKFDGIIHMPGATESQLNQMRDMVKSRHQGVQKAGEFLMLGGGDEAGRATFERVSFSPHEMEYQEGQTRIDKLVLAAAKVPEAIVWLNSANLASAQVANFMWTTEAITPRLVHDANELSAMLLPMFGLDPDDYRLVYDDVVPEDEAAEVDRSTRLVASGIITVNEARRGLRMEDSPDEAAERLMVNGVPLGEQPEAPAAGGFQIPLGFRTAIKGILTGHDHACGSCDIHTKDDDKRDPSGDLIPDETVNDLESRLIRWYRAQSVAGIAGGASADRSSLDSILQDAIESLVDLGIRSTIDELNIDDPEEFLRVRPERAIEYLQNYRIELAGEIAESAEEAIRGAVTRGLEEGLGTTEATQAVMDEWPEASAARAERVVRTESSRAFGQGKLAGYATAGVEGKTWRLAPGGCPICTAIYNGSGGVEKAGKEPHDLFEPFVKAGQTITGTDGRAFTSKRAIMANPAHPNCRCNIRAVLEGDE